MRLFPIKKADIDNCYIKISNWDSSWDNSTVNRYDIKPVDISIENIVKNENTIEEPKELIKKFKKPYKDYRATYLGVGMPYIWGQFIKTEKGVGLHLPKEIEDCENLIYIIRDKAKEMYLIGETQIPLSKRMSNYLTEINRLKNASLDKIKSIYDQIKLRPNDFQVSILFHLEKHQDIGKVETTFIKSFKKRGFKLYNMRNGGGGGCAILHELPSWYAVPNDGIFDLNNDQTAKVDQNVNLSAQSIFLDSFKKHRKEAHKNGDVFGGIYCFERNKSDKPEKVIRYIGLSGTLKTRIKNHLTRARMHKSNLGIKKADPKKILKKPKWKKSNLYLDLAKYPQQFQIKIIPIVYLNPETTSPEELKKYTLFRYLGDAEKYTIKIARQEGKVYNCDNGGGGSRSRNLCRRPIMKIEAPVFD